MDAAAVAGFFQAALEGGRLAHAYLLLGSDEAVSVAEDLASVLLCRAPENGRACNRCPDCRQVAAGSHPDLKVVAPEPNSIKIEQIRELQLSAGLTSFRAGRRVFLLKDAHKMTGDAANCLLKSLEEPTPGVFFILVAPNGEDLPATVVSRCQRFRVGGDTAGDGPALDSGARMDAFLASWEKGDVASLLRLGETLAEDKDKKAVPSFLDRLAAFFRDRAVQGEVAGDRGESLMAMVRCFERVETARRRLSVNANTRLLLDSLFLHLSGEAFGRNSLGSGSGSAL